jgi:lipopolysaccharide transport system permease protein
LSPVHFTLTFEKLLLCSSLTTIEPAGIQIRFTGWPSVVPPRFLLAGLVRYNNGDEEKSSSFSLKVIMNLAGNESVREAQVPTPPAPDATPESVNEVKRPARSGDPSFIVPDKPVVIIESSKAWVPVNLSDLWSYRELLYFLVWRDIKVRYKQTLLGALWAILQPLTTMIIFTYFFGKLARIPTDGIPYPVFFYTGLLIWTYFSGAVTNGANSLLGNTNLITKVYFPRLIIPAAAVGAGLVDFAIASILLIGFLIYYSFPVNAGYLMLLPLVTLTTLFALGLAVWLSALNVRYRDVRYALSFVIQVWMFVSPIIYPSTLVPEQWRWVLLLNPLTGIVEGFRAALFGQDFQWLALAYSTGFTLMLLVYAAYKFRRMERHFAEYI